MLRAHSSRHCFTLSNSDKAFLTLRCLLTSGDALGVDNTNLQAGDTLLQVNEAVQVLDRDDDKKVEAEKTDVKQRAVARSSLASEYEKKTRIVKATLVAAAAAAALAAGPAKPKAKAKGKGKCGGPPAPKLPATIDHITIKPFTPPGCYVWRGLTRGEWCGHCLPLPRVRCPWSVSGEYAAALSVLRTLWQQYCMLNGLSFPVDCPYSELHSDPLAITDDQDS